MEKTEKRRKARRAAALLAVFVLMGILLLRSAPVQALKLYRYACTHDTFTMGEATDFAWDTAYCGRVATLKEKYGLELSMEESNLSGVGMFLFFRNGKLVKILDYRSPFVHGVLVVGADRWEPDTVFRTEIEQEFSLAVLIPADVSPGALREKYALPGNSVEDQHGTLFRETTFTFPLANPPANRLQ